MARVTVEDCINFINNRFELVEIAAQRAKQIASGAPLTLDRDNDKDPVVSLREIAEQTVSIEKLKESVIQGYQRHHQAESADAAEEANQQVEEAFHEMQALAPRRDSEEEDDALEGEGADFSDDEIDAED